MRDHFIDYFDRLLDVLLTDLEKAGRMKARERRANRDRIARIEEKHKKLGDLDRVDLWGLSVLRRGYARESFRLAMLDRIKNSVSYFQILWS